MAKASKEIIEKHEQMFYPTVRVRTKKAGGSGTVVYSKEYDGEIYTYVITNHHVISDSVKIEKKWDSVLKRKVDKEKLDTVYVEFFRYNNYSHTIGSFAVEADIVAYSEVDGGQDWALLRVRDKENKADWVANMFPLNDLDNVHIFDQSYAVGASLGHPPVASEYEYIGIPSRISIQPMGFSADAITHMGYFIPIDRVYKLLEENDYQFIYDEKFTIDECNKARKKKQEPESNEEEE
jgi:S1-C subfamily serine protease